MRILFRDQKRCVIDVLATKCRQWNEPLKRDINGAKNKQTNKQTNSEGKFNEPSFVSLSGKQRNTDVVQNLHVGYHLLEVCV